MNYHETAYLHFDHKLRKRCVDRRFGVDHLGNNKIIYSLSVRMVMNNVGIVITLSTIQLQTHKHRRHRCFS